MTKLCVRLILLSFLITYTNNATASAPEYTPPVEPPLEIDEETGVALKFAGEREEGALEFFVKKSDLDNQITDVESGRLNDIAPAAGIQFRMRF